MAYYYSASERAFFSSEIMSVDAMPSDKVAVADQTYKQLMADQVAGKLIRTGSGNAPESVDQGLTAATRFGDVSFGKVTGTNLDINGNGDVSGTFVVGGAVTIKGSLNAQGGLNVTSITATGTSTLAAVNATNISASGTLKVNGASTLQAVSAKKVTATELDLNGNGDVSGNLVVHGKTTLEALQANGDVNVGGLLKVTGSATVGGKTVVLSVNGVQSDTSGNVQLGGDVFQYKKLSSIQSVAGSFWFDNLSGINTDELPDEILNGDWYGLQFGQSLGVDKTQVLFNGYVIQCRYSDGSLGNEGWTKDSWFRYDIRDIAQKSEVLCLDGSSTYSGKKLTWKTPTKTYNAIVVQEGDSNGAAFFINGMGGLTAIGGGESANTFRDNLESEGFSATNEQLFLLSDNGIYVVTEANNWDEREISHIHRNGWAKRGKGTVKGETGSDSVYFNLMLCEESGEATGNRFGGFEVTRYANKAVRTSMKAYDLDAGASGFAEIAVIKLADGTSGTYATSPVTSSDDNSIATTAWVRALFDALPGEETHICDLDANVTFAKGGSRICGTVLLQTYISIDSTGTRSDNFAVYVGSRKVATTSLTWQTRRAGGAGYGRNIEQTMIGKFEVSSSIQPGSQIRLVRESSNIGGTTRFCFAQITISK